MSKNKGDADPRETVSSTAECTGYMGSLKGAAEYRACTASEYLPELCQNFLFQLLQMLATQKSKPKILVTTIFALILKRLRNNF